MKKIIFINLFIILSSFQSQGLKIYYDNGKIAWDGYIARYNNDRIAWDKSGGPKYENGNIACDSWFITKYESGRNVWDGLKAKYDSGHIAWDGSVAYYDNGRRVWDNTKVYHENGTQLLQNVNIQALDPTILENTKPTELIISDKIRLLFKMLNNKYYVVGLKIQLSKKNSILIDRENKLTTNIIDLSKDIHFEVTNRKVTLRVFGQNVVSKN